MLHRDSFDEHFASSNIDDEKQPDDNKKEKLDHSFKGPDELNPKICPDCGLELKATRYNKKDPVNNVQRCENCGYLRCIRCGISQSGPPDRKIVVQCSEKYCPFS